MIKKIKKPKNINIRKLYPKHWTQEFQTAEEVVYYGKDFVRTMIKFKLEQLACLEHERELIKEKIGLVGMGREFISTRAQRYENPSFPSIGHRYECSEHLEPLDDASLTRKSGKTTLNCCGWCRFAQPTGDGERNGYHITAYCSFKTLVSGTDYKRRFNQKCFLPKAPCSVLTGIVGGLFEADGKLIGKIRRIESEIAFLRRLESLAEKKPLLPEFREPRFFKTGNRVVCFLDNVPDKNTEKDFAAGRISKDNPYPVVRFDEAVRKGRNREKRSMSFLPYGPNILREWEFRYLVDHPDFAKVWLENCALEKYTFINAKRLEEALNRYRQMNKTK